MRNLVERLNLRHVWYWLGLSGLTGLVGGLGALAFKWLTEEGARFFWNLIVGFGPASAGGEPASYAPAPGPPWLPGLIVAPALGGSPWEWRDSSLAPPIR